MQKEVTYRIRPVDEEEKSMANGMRNTSGTPLNDEEIAFVKKEIARIGADESVFVFNHPDYTYESTCYNYLKDKVYVTRNVFPDEKYASSHPRDTMSVGAVLAHEYYGHRAYRQEYLDDERKGNGFHTTPLWQDECRASLRAAQLAPGLTQIDRRDLVLDAVFRAKEFGQIIEMNDFMKEAVYGYSRDERGITEQRFDLPRYISEARANRDEEQRNNQYSLPQMRKCTSRNDDPER